MPQRLMDHYDQLPMNGVLAGVSSFFGLVVSGIDPVWTGIVLPVALFAAGKVADFAFKVWLERRRKP